MQEKNSNRERKEQKREREVKLVTERKEYTVMEIELTMKDSVWPPHRNDAGKNEPSQSLLDAPALSSYITTSFQRNSSCPIQLILFSCFLLHINLIFLF